MDMLIELVLPIIFYLRALMYRGREFSIFDPWLKLEHYNLISFP